MEISICFGNITLLSLNSTSLVPNIEHISGTSKMAVTNKVRKAKLIKRKMIGLLQRYILSDLIKSEQIRTSINKRPIIPAVLLYNIADKLFLKTKYPGYQRLQSIVLFWAAYSELCNFCKFWQLALPACIHFFSRLYLLTYLRLVVLIYFTTLFRNWSFIFHSYFLKNWNWSTFL